MEGQNPGVPQFTPAEMKNLNRLDFIGVSKSSSAQKDFGGFTQDSPQSRKVLTPLLPKVFSGIEKGKFHFLFNEVSAITRQNLTKFVQKKKRSSNIT